jgi:hypothetical protein
LVENLKGRRHQRTDDAEPGRRSKRARCGEGFDPQAFDFVLEIAGHVVGAMIVTQLQSPRHPGRDGSEAAMPPWRTGSKASKRLADRDA